MIAQFIALLSSVLTWALSVAVASQQAAQQIIVHEWPSSAFFEVVLAVESVYNQRYFAGPGHRVNSSVIWLKLPTGYINSVQ